MHNLTLCMNFALCALFTSTVAVLHYSLPVILIIMTMMDSRTNELIIPLANLVELGIMSNGGQVFGGGAFPIFTDLKEWR